MIWGEVADFIKKKQEHAQEIERMQIEAGLEAARHERDMARIKMQSDLNVREVQVVGDVAVAKAEADAFTEAMRNAWKPTGIRWVDAWNGTIRPAAATISLALWVLALAHAGFILDDWDRQLVSVILGFYVADRTLSKRGK